MNNSTPILNDSWVGTFEVETAHIVDGIPDAPPNLEPRVPFSPPAM